MPSHLARGRRGACLAAQLIIACALLAALAPSAASAATYTVDTVADEPDAAADAACAAVSGKCTLRAAIEVANGAAGRDEIGFDSKLFNGELGDTIEPATELPAITDSVVIADWCPPNQFNEIPTNPCAGLDPATGDPGFRVKGDEVTIEGFALTGASVAISVTASADQFVARRNWIGVDLDLGTAGNGTGIYLGPGANDAGIGIYGKSWWSGNLIVNSSEVGLDLEGASRALVIENQFGVLEAEAAPNGTNIEITDATAPSLVKAVENQIGHEVFHAFGGELLDRCSEGCNEISGAVEDGIDLQGDGGDELPASGPTVIKGNFIGTDYGGKVAVPNGHVGILVGEADRVTIGGSEEDEGNRMSGGLWAALAGPEARELTIASNIVGLRSDGGLLDPPSAGGFSVDSAGISYPEGRAEIVGNVIRLLEGVGVSSKGGSPLIAANWIFGSDLGIHAFGDYPGWYGAITGNFLEFPGAQGILVESSNVRLFANEVYFADGAGIEVSSGAGGVEIGNDDVERENTIEWNDGAAIAVTDDETEFVDVGINHGAENGGPFIDLGGDGPGNQPTGPNRGVQPPTVGTATTTGASGTASLSGAFVRVFAKGESGPGEIERFLGSAVTTTGGKWSVVYDGPIPGGTEIAVSQTTFGGTSELAFATTATPQPPEKKVVCAVPQVNFNGICIDAPCPPSLGCGGGPTRFLFARIVGGPEGGSARTTATFRFSASVPGSKFKCRLDDRAFASCRSPKTYKKLKPGKHVFKVKATDSSGNVSAVVTRRFTVLE